MSKRFGGKELPWRKMVWSKPAVSALAVTALVGTLLFGLARPGQGAQVSSSGSGPASPVVVGNPTTTTSPTEDPVRSEPKPTSTIGPATTSELERSKPGEQIKNAPAMRPPLEMGAVSSDVDPDQYYFRAPQVRVSNYSEGSRFPLDGFTSTVFGLAYPERFRPIGGPSDDLANGVQFQRGDVWIDMWAFEGDTVLAEANRITGDTSAHTNFSVPVAELGINAETGEFTEVTITDRSLPGIAVQQASDLSGLQTTYVLIQHPDHILEFHINDDVNAGAVAFGDLLAELLVFESVG